MTQLPAIERLRYRPEIDGLRGLAVLAVLLFHAGFGCPGGYVGVDVFFVISGYLITALIWQDLTLGTFSMVRFWEKRARRIVPALVAVTLTVIVAGMLLHRPNDLADLGRATASQAVFSANFHYWHSAGYFDTAAAEKPLLHTWSLAVEEQFYLIVPWLLCGLFAIERLRKKWVILSILSIVAGSSLALSVVSLSRFPSATFYLLPSRAWELLIGSLVVFLPQPRWLQRQGVQRELFSFCGLLLIVVPIICYSSQTAFPGWAAVPPCLGAALLIAVDRRSIDRRSAPQRLTGVGWVLSRPACVFVGLISYSLYLWHWPLFAFATALSLEPLSLMLRGGLLGCSLIAAVLSWKFIETPFRIKALGATRASMFRWATGGLAAVAGLGALCILQAGMPQRFSQSVLARMQAVDETSLGTQMTVEDARAGRYVSLGAQAVGRVPSVLVWGDSHAMAVLPAVDALLRERKLAGQAATHSSTLPVSQWYVPTKWGLREASLEFSHEVLEHIARERIADVLLVAYWRGYGLSDPQRQPEFEKAMLNTIERLTSAGARAWVLLDVPAHSFNVPKALTGRFYSPRYIDSLCATPATLPEDGPNAPALRTRIIAAGGRVLDPKPMFLDASGEYYRVLSDNIPLYRDQQHLTSSGAMEMLLPFLRNAMSDLGQPIVLGDSP